MRIALVDMRNARPSMAMAISREKRGYIQLRTVSVLQAPSQRWENRMESMVTSQGTRVAWWNWSPSVTVGCTADSHMPERVPVVRRLRTYHHPAMARVASGTSSARGRRHFHMPERVPVVRRLRTYH